MQGKSLCIFFLGVQLHYAINLFLCLYHCDEIVYLNTYGYVRVSSREQNEDRQLIALIEVGLTGKMIFLDKQSGKDFNRPQVSVKPPRA